MVDTVENGVLICGLGRCGSSLVCQMFHAGGADVAGKYPSFETPESFNGAWVVDQLSAGRVVKVLDPFRYDLPDLGETPVIWLDRNPKQQARSIIKLGVAFGQVTRSPTGKDFGGMRKLLERDRLKAMRFLKQVCKVKPHVFKFEDIIAAPEWAATQFTIVSKKYLNVVRMADQVIERRPECLPNLLEIEQYIRGENAQGN